MPKSQIHNIFIVTEYTTCRKKGGKRLVCGLDDPKESTKSYSYHRTVWNHFAFIPLMLKSYSKSGKIL
jgi:hypothetical protein